MKAFLCALVAFLASLVRLAPHIPAIIRYGRHVHRDKAEREAERNDRLRHSEKYRGQ